MNDALSRMPLTRIIVTSTVMRMAGRSSTVPVETSSPVAGSKSNGALVNACGRLHAEECEEVLEVVRPAVRDGRRGDGVLEDEVPADDPRDQLAERGVGVGIGRAGDRHHRGELGVAERREHAGQAGDHERQHQRRTGAIVGRDAGQHEDAGADDGADAEAGQLHGAEHAMEPLLAVHFIEQRFQRFSFEQMRQRCLPQQSLSVAQLPSESPADPYPESRQFGRLRPGGGVAWLMLISR